MKLVWFGALNLWICLTNIAFLSKYTNAERLCFKIQENHMAWPIADPNEFHLGPFHGVHCYESLARFSKEPPKDEGEQMHFDYCRRNVIAMYDSITKEPPVYRISRTMCSYILPWIGSEHSRGNKYSSAHSTRRHPKSNNTNDEHKSGGNPRYKKLQSAASNQMELFYGIGAANFGDILWKAFTNVSSLTKPEKDMYASLESRRVARLSALGVVCSHRASVEMATKSLENVIAETDFNKVRHKI